MTRNIIACEKVDELDMLERMYAEPSGDLISREDAIEVVCRTRCGDKAKGCPAHSCPVIEEFDALQSAETHEIRTETHECVKETHDTDLISRADAKREVYLLGKNPSINDIWDCINSLPSADRPIEHDGCDGCQHEHKAETEYPCTECKQNYRDKYRRKENTSSADRPKGEWIIRDDMPKLDNTYSIECSECGQLMFGHYNADNPNYCPNCGADMQLDK